jgi:amino acid transporter
VAILVSAVFYTIFSYSNFADLAVVDVILYSAGILLEFAALAILRRREPDLSRPFRVGGGAVGLAFVCLAPTAMVAFGLYSQFQEEGRTALLLSLGALATGPVAYLVMRRLRRPETGESGPGLPA